MVTFESDDLDGQDDRRRSADAGGFIDEGQLNLLFKECEDGLSDKKSRCTLNAISASCAITSTTRSSSFRMRSISGN